MHLECTSYTGTIMYSSLAKPTKLYLHYISTIIVGVYIHTCSYSVHNTHACIRLYFNEPALRLHIACTVMHIHVYIHVHVSVSIVTLSSTDRARFAMWQWPHRLTQFLEELIEHAHEVSQSDIVVGHHTLYLVKLSKVCSIQRLITKHTIDREPLHWSEFFLRGRETGEGEGAGITYMYIHT